MANERMNMGKRVWNRMRVWMLLLAVMVCGGVFLHCSYAAVTEDESTIHVEYQEGQWIPLGNVDEQNYVFQYPDGTKEEVSFGRSDARGILYYRVGNQKTQIFYENGQYLGMYVGCVSGKFLGVFSYGIQNAYYTTLFEIGAPENLYDGFPGRCILSDCVFSENGVRIRTGVLLQGGLQQWNDLQVLGGDRFSYEEQECVIDPSGAYKQYLKRDLYAARTIEWFSADSEDFAEDSLDRYFTIPAGKAVRFVDYQELNTDCYAYLVQTEEDEGWILCDSDGALLLQRADLTQVLSSYPEASALTSADADYERSRIWASEDFVDYYSADAIGEDSIAIKGGEYLTSGMVDFDFINENVVYFETKETTNGQRVYRLSYPDGRGRSPWAALPQNAEGLICVEVWEEQVQCGLILQYTENGQAYTSIYMEAGGYLIPMHFCEEQEDGTLNDLGIALAQQCVTVNISQEEQEALAEVITEETGDFGIYYMECASDISCNAEGVVTIKTDEGVQEWQLEGVNKLVRR
jgi:hypothetical protein